MPLDAGFLGLLSQTGTVTPAAAEDTFGNQAYGAPFSIVMFLDGLTQAFPDAKTADQQNGSPVYTGTAITDAVGIKVKDKITAPGGRVMFVVSVETFKDEAGLDLYQSVEVTTNERG